MDGRSVTVAVATGVFLGGLALVLFVQFWPAILAIAGITTLVCLLIFYRKKVVIYLFVGAGIVISLGIAAYVMSRQGFLQTPNLTTEWADNVGRWFATSDETSNLYKWMLREYVFNHLIFSMIFQGFGIAGVVLGSNLLTFGETKRKRTIGALFFILAIPLLLLFGMFDMATQGRQRDLESDIAACRTDPKADTLSGYSCPMVEFLVRRQEVRARSNN